MPLFIEEFANIEIDRPEVNRSIGRTGNTSLPAFAPLPSRLIDLLTERLERIGDARDAAGLAAAIGRDFPLALLASVSDLPAEKLQQHVQLLLDSGWVLRGSPGNEHVGRFKHALWRDSAYSLLLQSRRKHIHARIAICLESVGWLGEPAPLDLLAMHHTVAEHIDRAFDLWMTAGLQARRNSEQREAISHFQHAKSLIGQLEVDSERQRCSKALEVHLALLCCYVAQQGYSSDEAYPDAKYAETYALQCGTLTQHINARLGLVSWLFSRGKIN